MKTSLKIKLDFIIGLKEVVLKEMEESTNFVIEKQGNANSLYLEFTPDFRQVMNLRSVLRAYIVSQDRRFTPYFISNHKSLLGDIISLVIEQRQQEFKTFKIHCAGSDSKEVRDIAHYIEKTYKLSEADDADLKIYMIKIGGMWEIGVQMTSRPLSLRNYKVLNMSGAMDSTISFAVNSLCELQDAQIYLNIFSGSATLLIEAGLCYTHLNKMIGFDKDKKCISLAMRNIRQAGLIRKIQLKEKDIFDNPDLGKFDVITSDLPFGMSISRGEDLGKLYRRFIEYCEEFLNIEGILVIYTNECKMLEKIILKSRFFIIKKLELKLITALNIYIYPKIFVCRFIKSPH